MSSPPAEAAAVPPHVLDVLRADDNPFEVYVQPRRAASAFARTHVPAVNSDVFDTLQAAIERYRPGRGAPPANLTEDDLPRSGVAVIDGKRGSGKTHLLHALRTCRPNGFVVTPQRFDAHRPFPEYLLQQLVQTLHDESEWQSPGALAGLADWFARRAIVQALYAMPATDWLAHNVRRRHEEFFALFGWGTQGALQRRELLIGSLLDANASRLGDVCRFREQDPITLRRIAQRHVETAEAGKAVSAQIRRGLALKLLDLAWDGDATPVIEHLLDGFTQVEAIGTPARDTLVEELFQALVELFLLQGRPVVFVFDALEAILGDPPAADVCQRFFSGLGNALDTFRGIPFFLLAESGHWEAIQKTISSYALQRFQQGVPTCGRGALSRLAIPPVTLDDLQKLVAGRMRPMLERCHPAGTPVELSMLPFSDVDLEAALGAAASEPPLRQVLQRLSARYEALVFGRTPSGGRPSATSDGVAATSDAAEDLRAPVAGPELLSLRPGDDWRSAMQRVWTQELRTAERRVTDQSLTILADALYAGLEQWLKRVDEAQPSIDGWRLSHVVKQMFGNHPTHGQVVRCTWRTASRDRRRGVLFFLATGKGMPIAMEAILSAMLSKKSNLDELLIFWPRTITAPGASHAHLPDGTRAVWERFQNSDPPLPVRLLAIEPTDLAPWLAIEPWERSLRDDVEGLPPEQLRTFALEQTESLLRIITPEEPTP